MVKHREQLLETTEEYKARKALEAEVFTAEG